MRILLAAHYSSDAINGESVIPLQLFRRLRARDLDVWLVTHDSNQAELTETFPDQADRIRFVRSLPGMAPVFTRGETWPDGIRTVAWGVTQVERQLAMLPTVRNLVREERIDVVHQPIGISPSVPSAMLGIGAPLVVGPLIAGMAMPPAFIGRETTGFRITQWVRDAGSTAANRVVPGKRNAVTVLVANERTRDYLPRGLRGRIVVSPENGVVLDDWPPRDHDRTTGPPTFVFLGRLVHWKGADLLIEAFAALGSNSDARLLVIGDGPERPALEALAQRLDVTDRVRFTGWLGRSEASQLMREADVFVSPSLREPGGTSVLEAMATALPVVVSNWGGPAELVDDASGIRVPVDTRAGFIAGLTDALARLAGDRDLRRRMGGAARERVRRHYDWEVLIDRLVDVYHQAAGSTGERGDGQMP